MKMYKMREESIFINEIMDLLKVVVFFVVV